jgi:ankyrin repeat protein
MSKSSDAVNGSVAIPTLISSKRLDHDECHRLALCARPIAAAVLRVRDGLLAAVHSIVRQSAAMSSERLEIVKVLSEKLVLAQLTSCDKFGLNVAATAVAFGSVDSVSFLLMDRSLPHHQSVKLLMHNTDAYISQDSQEPPQYSTVSLLHLAALRGDATIVRLLCRINPLSVNDVSSDGMTALHYAIAVRSPLSSIDALLAHGADPGAECRGTNAYALAGHIYSDALELLTMHAPFARKKISMAGDDSASEEAAGTSDAGDHYQHSENSVFDWASQGNLAAVNKALKRGFDVESRNNIGQTLLMVACAYDQRAIAKRAMKYGADMDAADLDGKTAAHIALQRGKREICEYLLKSGASKNLPDGSGVTVEFLLANPESLLSYAQQLQLATSRQTQRSCVNLSRQSACIVLQRFALDSAQSYRARCHLKLHGSCAGSGRAMSQQPWPKKSSYVIMRHRKMYSTIVLLQCNWRCHDSRYVAVVEALFVLCIVFQLASLMIVCF